MHVFQHRAGATATDQRGRLVAQLKHSPEAGGRRWLRMVPGDLPGHETASSPGVRTLPRNPPSQAPSGKARPLGPLSPKPSRHSLAAGLCAPHSLRGAGSGASSQEPVEGTHPNAIPQTSAVPQDRRPSRCLHGRLLQLDSPPLRVWPPQLNHPHLGCYPSQRGNSWVAVGPAGGAFDLGDGSEKPEFSAQC